MPYRLYRPWKQQRCIQVPYKDQIKGTQCWKSDLESNCSKDLTSKKWDLDHSKAKVNFSSKWTQNLPVLVFQIKNLTPVISIDSSKKKKKLTLKCRLILLDILFYSHIIHSHVNKVLINCNQKRELIPSTLPTHHFSLKTWTENTTRERGIV